MSNLHLPISMGLVVLSLFAAKNISGRTRDLTKAEAQELVAIYLGKKVTSLPHFGLDTLASFDRPMFYAFEVTATNSAPDASPVIGSYAVNRATGDVWKLVVCERIDTPSLRRAQRTMISRIKLDRKEFRDLGARAPCEP